MRVHIIISESIAPVIMEYVHFFTDRKDQVKILTPDDKTNIEKNDLLLLPDTGGLNLTAGGMYPSYDLPLNFPPQDQFMEYFRVHRLKYYKDRKCKIWSVGTSACMLWESEGGKLCYADDIGTIIPLVHGSTMKNTDLNYDGTRYDFWIQRNLRGKSRFVFSDEYYRQISRFMSETTIVAADSKDVEPILAP